MDKVILVINAPENCGKCMFFDGFDGCKARKPSLFVMEDDKRPKGCPLRPLPDRKVVKPEDTTAAVAVKYGWNNCINEILKEEEGWY